MSSINDEKFMKEALKEAETSLREGNWPIGCVIELDGKIIARAHNQVYTQNDKTAHAEMLAIKQVQDVLMKNVRKATLYTTYEPCPMCFGGIILSKIKRVVSGIDLDKSGSMYFKENLPILFKSDKFDVKFETGILADESYEIFIQGEPTKKLLENGLIRKKPPIARLQS